MEKNLINVSIYFQVIGRLEMGVKGVCTTAIRHWNDVRKSPRRQIADWHKLYE